SRRRHTRFPRDWSSDVCSSDLVGKSEYLVDWKTKYLFPAMGMIPIDRSGGSKSQAALDAAEAVLRRGELFGIYPEGTSSRDGARSEERSVGKAGAAGGGAEEGR